MSNINSSTDMEQNGLLAESALVQLKLEDYVNSRQFISIKDNGLSYRVNMLAQLNSNGEWVALGNRIVPDETYYVSFFNGGFS